MTKPRTNTPPPPPSEVVPVRLDPELTSDVVRRVLRRYLVELRRPLRAGPCRVVVSSGFGSTVTVLDGASSSMSPWWSKERILATAGIALSQPAAT